MNMLVKRFAWPATTLLIVGLLSLIPSYGFFAAAGAIVVFTLLFATVFPQLLLWPIIIGLIVGQLTRVGGSDGAGGLLLIDIAVAAYAGIGFVSVLIKKRPFNVSVPGFLLGIFVLWAGVTLLLNAPALEGPDLSTSAFYWVRLFLIWLSFVITPLLFTGVKDHASVSRRVAWAGALLVTLGYAQLLIFPNFGFMAAFGWDPHVGRLLSTFFDPNFFGMFLAFLVTLLTATILTRPTKWPIWLLTLASVVALVLTFSRSGYLALAISLAIILAIRSWKIMLVSMMVITIASLQVPRVRDRIAGAFQVDTTSKDRIESWQESLTIIGDHPIIGVGYNAYGPVSVDYGFKKDLSGRSSRGGDSSVLFVTATTGVIGLILYLLFLASILWQAITVYKRTTDPHWRVIALTFIGVWPALFIHSQFVNSLFYPLVVIPILLIATGLGLAFHSLYKSEPDR